MHDDTCGSSCIFFTINIHFLVYKLKKMRYYNYRNKQAICFKEENIMTTEKIIDKIKNLLDLANNNPK